MTGPFDTIDMQCLNPEQARLMDSISKEVRAVYNAVITDLSSRNRDSIDWWVSNIASRNVFVSQLFSDCCRLYMIERLVGDGISIGTVRVKSRALAETLRRYFSARGLSARVECRVGLSERLARAFRRLCGYPYQVFRFLASFVSARLTRKYQRLSPDGQLTIIDTFVFEDSFRNGAYIDRYYCGMLDFLSPLERKTIWYTPTFYSVRVKSFLDLFLKMRTASENFLLKEDLLRMSDYFYALTYPFRAARFGFADIMFSGFDITPLIREELSAGIFSSSSMEALLKYRFAQRLCESGVKLRLIVDWFENQPIDRGANAGFRVFFPETHIIGYQGFVVTTNYLGLYPTDMEKECGVIPHEVAVSGKGLVGRAREFCSSLEVSVAPAFRYAELSDKRKHRPEHSGFSILIALPMMWRDAADILMIADQVIGDSDFSDVTFLIKPHPTHAAGLVEDFLKSKERENVLFINGAFAECLEKARLLISNVSNVCMETLAMGIPVVIIGSCSGLTHNPIPENISSDIWRLCYCREELKEAICFFKNHGLPRERLEAIGDSILDDYYEPVTETSARRFLCLE
ncbi:MAG: hypothetical protein EPN22_04535 [Nitrospirae bacterium]|nr:MAG: hypothetical protein EPN22_04535 [Nitrospirota bacterium]